MTEFWEEAFKDKQEMWGLAPAKSAVLTKDFFVGQQVKSVLIPGIGYGRNAQIFMDNGMTVTGIEISQTAIDLAGKHLNNPDYSMPPFRSKVGHPFRTKVGHPFRSKVGHFWH